MYQTKKTNDVVISDLKLERWNEAIADCNWVLSIEPENLKGKSSCIYHVMIKTVIICESGIIVRWGTVADSVLILTSFVV